MVEFELGPLEIDFGLYLIEEDPGLTFIFFIAYAILIMLGLRFGYYAQKNLSNTELQSQRSIWLYLRYIGVLGTLYGMIGILEIVSSVEFAAKNGLLLGMTLMIAFGIRQIHFVATGTRDGSYEPFEQMARAIFIALIFVYVIAVMIAGLGPVAATIEGLSAIAFFTYAIAYFHDQTSNTRLQGTLLDSLMRHLLPVITFSSLVSIIALWHSLGLEWIVVLHVQVVFIIMTATALMTGTVKLRQNLAGL